MSAREKLAVDARHMSVQCGIPFVEACKLTMDAARYESMSAREKLAFDARLVSVQCGIPFVDACKRLGLQ